MWRELVDRWADEVELAAPASEDEVRAAGERLGQPLPGVLRGLLAEFDGLVDAYGTDVVWSAGGIAEANLEFRNSAEFADLYAPFEDLLFFGDNGGGDQFAFGGRHADSFIVVWDHETDTRAVVAPTLQEYLTRALRADGGDWYR